MKRSLVAVCLIALLGLAAAAPAVVPVSQAWVAIAAYADSRGASTGDGVALGLLGVYASALHGAAWGALLGGPAGIVAGIAVGA